MFLHAIGFGIVTAAIMSLMTVTVVGDDRQLVLGACDMTLSVLCEVLEAGDRWCRHCSAACSAPCSPSC